MAVFKMMHPPNVANLVMIFHWKKCKIQFYSLEVQCDHWFGERVAEWLRRLKAKGQNGRRFKQGCQLAYWEARF